MTDSTPGSGVPFAVSMKGGPANAAIILTVTSEATSTTSKGIDIAGTMAHTAMRDATSAAAWTVTLTEAGVYTLVGTNTAGTVRGTQTVTVSAAPTAAPVGSLSRTGFDPRGFLIGGGLLLLAGSGALLVAKRRKSAQASI